MSSWHRAAACSCPRNSEKSGFTRLVQQVGTMLYKVHHTGVPHFAVQTPMLAAVVKGTSFTVIVEKDRAAVQVTDGVVEVSSAVGQARRLVERGVTVYVGREQPGAIIEMKPGTMSPPDPAKTSGVKITRSGDVPLSTIASLTGGLVNAAPAVSAVGASEPQSAAGAASQNGPSSVQPAVEQALQVAFNDPAHSSSDRTPGLTQPVFNIVQASAPGIAGSDALGSAPAATEPVIDIVQTAVPAVTQPVAGHRPGGCARSDPARCRDRPDCCAQQLPSPSPASSRPLSQQSLSPSPASSRPLSLQSRNPSPASSRPLSLQSLNPSPASSRPLFQQLLNPSSRHVVADQPVVARSDPAGGERRANHRSHPAAGYQYRYPDNSGSHATGRLTPRRIGFASRALGSAP